jgi:hypothetical protein
MTFLKESLRSKLVELNSDFADSDMLIDFVAVMVKNSKPKDYVLNQLLDCKRVY